MSNQRAINSGVISFGLVSIPFKTYTSASAKSVNFKTINPVTGNQIGQALVDKGTGKSISRSDTVKGFEILKDKFVTFTTDEINVLQGEKSNSIDICEFISEKDIDLYRCTEKVYFLGPDKGGDKAYRVLFEALKKTGRVAVAKWFPRGKEHLVIVRAHGNDLVLHQIYYQKELRSFDNPCEEYQIQDNEMRMACQLIDQLSVDKFDYSKYTNSFKLKVLEAVEAKNNGKEIKVITPKKSIFDLFDALKASLSKKAS